MVSKTFTTATKHFNLQQSTIASLSLDHHQQWTFDHYQQWTFTPLPWLPVLSNTEPSALRRKAATDKLVEKIVKHDSWPIQPDILNPPLLRLTSRKPLWLDGLATS